MSTPPQTDWLSRWADYRPEAPAIQEGSQGPCFTYSQVNQMADFFAVVMTREWKLQPGDRLAILSENTAEMVFLFGAAQKSWGILVPLNWRLSPSEIAYLLGDAQPKAFWVQEKFLAALQAKEASQKALKEIPHLITHEEGRERGRKALEEGNSPSFLSQRVKMEDPIFILYTSGTTGFPKGAIYTHEMLFWNSVNTALRLDISSKDRTLNVMPLFHTGGWNVLLSPFLHRGAFTVLMKSFEPGEVLNTLESERASIFMGVPTMLGMMAQEQGFDRSDLSSLRYMFVGGEAMPIPLIETYHSKGIPIRQGYGMTEAGPNLTSLNHEDAVRKKGSIGKPNFYVDLRIVDSQGRDLESGEAGELLIGGPVVTPGYWNNPAATQKSKEGGWLHTGDMALRDEEGFLYIVDRIKNMYISGGENVYPAEVERILRLHPSIAEAVVVPTPHPKWGETGRAFVRLKEGMETEESEVILHCREHLAKFEVPKSVIFLEEIPQNGTGKVDRQKLKAWKFS